MVQPALKLFLLAALTGSSLAVPHLNINHEGSSVQSSNLIGRSPVLHKFTPRKSDSKTENHEGSQPKASEKLEEKNNLRGTNLFQAQTKSEGETPRIILEASAALDLAVNGIDDDLSIIQNLTSTPEQIRKAAVDALKNEEIKNYPRELLASAASDPQKAQISLGAIRDTAPIIISGFKKIKNNSQDSAQISEALVEVVNNRVKNVNANKELMRGVGQAFGSGNDSGNQLVLDENQRKAVEEARSRLSTQNTILDDQIRKIEDPSSTLKEIKNAATKAIEQAKAEDFDRQVLASAANNPKAAMEALAGLRNFGPNEIITGFLEISSDPENHQNLNKNLDLITRGRRVTVPVNQKLLELTSSISSEKSQGTNSPDPKDSSTPKRSLLIKRQGGPDPNSKDQKVKEPGDKDNKDDKDKKVKEPGDKDNKENSGKLPVNITRDASPKNSTSSGSSANVKVDGSINLQPKDKDSKKLELAEKLVGKDNGGNGKDGLRDKDGKRGITVDATVKVDRNTQAKTTLLENSTAVGDPAINNNTSSSQRTAQTTSQNPKTSTTIPQGSNNDARALLGFQVNVNSSEAPVVLFGKSGTAASRQVKSGTPNPNSRF